MACYIPRWYIRPTTVTHPSTNRARRALTSFTPNAVNHYATPSSDPKFVTPAVKALLHRKNRLMRRERTHEADALATRGAEGQPPPQNFFLFWISKWRFVVHSCALFCSSAKTLMGRKDTLAQVYFYWGGGQSPPSPPGSTPLQHLAGQEIHF